jgi:hypothetical protein
MLAARGGCKPTDPRGFGHVSGGDPLVRGLRYGRVGTTDAFPKSREVFMCSNPFDSATRRRTTRLTFSLAALAAMAACGDADKTDPANPAMKDLNEVAGTVQTWPGEAAASCGERLVVTRFNDDVGGRAGVETRALITTPQAYQEYFGHAPPPGVQLGREWVVFYSSGRRGGGYTADVSVVGVRGDVLHVVTTLTSPIPPCPPPVPVPGMGGGTGGASGGSGTGMGTAPAAMTTPAAGPTSSAGGAVPPAPDVAPVPPTMRPLPYVLVRFPAQRTRSVDFQHQDINPGCGPYPQPPLCTSSQQCGRGQRCSTERGDCLPCSRDPAAICPAVCFGICEVIPTPPPTNPCAAILCPTGTECVVLDSYPPQAKCVPVQPPPDRCTSSATCPRGTRCSTERGDCQGCGAGPGVACPAVCFGVCEPTGTGVCTGGALMGGCRSAEEIKLEAARLCERQKLTLTEFAVGNACFAGGFESARYTCCSPTPPPPPPPPVVCKVDSDCLLVAGGCNQSPCTCSAQPADRRVAPCQMTGVACLVDPCANKVAACVNGQCMVQPQPQPPPPACESHYLGGMVCKTYDQWKQEASEVCKASGKQLTDLGGGAACNMVPSFTEVKFTCCPTR